MTDLLSLEDAIDLIQDPVGDPLGGLSDLCKEVNTRAEERRTSAATFTQELEADLDSAQKKAKERRDKDAAFIEAREKECSDLRKDLSQSESQIEHLQEKLLLADEKVKELLNQGTDAGPRPSASLHGEMEALRERYESLKGKLHAADQLAKGCGADLEKYLLAWKLDETNMKAKLDLKREGLRLVSQLRGIPEAEVLDLVEEVAA